MPIAVIIMMMISQSIGRPNSIAIFAAAVGGIGFAVIASVSW